LAGYHPLATTPDDQVLGIGIDICASRSVPDLGRDANVRRPDRDVA
jgi:hypothetical protein